MKRRNAHFQEEKFACCIWDFLTGKSNPLFPLNSSFYGVSVIPEKLKVQEIT